MLCLDLSSDHSPILLILQEQIQQKSNHPSLTNRQTNWNDFRANMNNLITSQIPLKNEEDVENAVTKLTMSIQMAAWTATPKIQEKVRNEYCPNEIIELITEKRKLRKIWQRTKLRSDKTRFNKMVKKLKTSLQNLKNNSVENYLSNLTPTQFTDYDLWKATRKLKNPTQHQHPIKSNSGIWARNNAEKANVMAEHLRNVFQPWDMQTPVNNLKAIEDHLSSPFQLSYPIPNIKIKEVKHIIKNYINPK